MRSVVFRGATAVLTIASGLVLGLSAPARAADPGPQLLGAQLHTMWDSSTPAQVDAQLDLLKAMGADTARVDVAWASLQEGGRGQISSWYADRLDHLVTASAARGIRPIITLLDTPCWASSAPATIKQSCSGAYWDRGTQFYAPTDPADFGWIAGWVASHYGTRLAAIELWNEPNFDDGSYADLRAPDKAVAYTAMVEAAYPAIKSAAPSLPVLAGSLSYSDTQFLDRLFAAGMRHFDGISVHPYNEGRAPGSAYDPKWIKADFVHGLPALHDDMVAKGFSDRSVWITEMGWSTCAAGSSYWCVTPTQQASYLASAVGYASTWTWLRSFVAYTLRNGGTDSTDREQNFGLTSSALAPKPAFVALRDAFALARANAASAPATADPVPAPGDPTTTSSTTPVSTTALPTTTTATTIVHNHKIRPRPLGTSASARHLRVRIGQAYRVRAIGTRALLSHRTA